MVIERVVFIKPIFIAKMLAIVCKMTKGQEDFLVSYPPIKGFNIEFVRIPPIGPAKHINEYNNVILSWFSSWITVRIKSHNQKCKQVFNPCRMHLLNKLNIYNGFLNKITKSEKKSFLFQIQYLYLHILYMIISLSIVHPHFHLFCYDFSFYEHILDIKFY